MTSTSTLRPEDVVRLRNVGATDFKAQYANIPYTVRPGQETVVQFAAACLWLGHPDAVDVDEKRRYRTDEYLRLMMRYGVYDGSPLPWETAKPSVECFTLDGDRLVTVVDDPEGKHLSPATSSLAERERMLDQMARMQQQMTAMQAQVDAKAREDASVANGGELDEDTVPEQFRKPPSQGPLSVPVPATPSAIDQGAEVTEDTPTRVKVGLPRATG